MNKKNLMLIAGVLLALPIVARAQTIYTDTFNTNGDTTGYNTPVGWTYDGAGLNYPPYVSPTDYDYLGNGNSTNGTGKAYVGVTGVAAGTLADFLVSTGNLETNPNSSTVTPGLDNPTLMNTNVGATFLANTTYTLTYLVGSELTVVYSPTYQVISTGTESVSLLDAGSVIASSTKSAAVDSLGAFVAGQTVTFDTATDPSVVGDAIGIDANWLNTSTLNKEVGFDDFVLKASADSAATPEPSTYALFGVGLMALVLHMRRKSLAARV